MEFHIFNDEHVTLKTELTMSAASHPLDSTKAAAAVSAFVRLTPSNEAAIRAFSKVVDTVSTNPHRFEHQSKFLTSSVTQCRLSSLIRDPSVGSTSETGTETGVEPESILERSELVWTGHLIYPSRLLHMILGKAGVQAGDDGPKRNS